MFRLKTAKPISASASAVVECPLGSAFNFVGHGFFQNYARWSPQVVELQPLSEGPMRQGVKARQVTLDRGIRTESTFEIVQFGPPQLLGIKGVSEPFRSFYEFEEATTGSTQIAFSFEVEEQDLFMLPFGALFRGALQEGAQRTVENIKQLLESQHASAASPERLASFVYVASLDLQEPLRKIEAFSELLDNAFASSNKRDMAYARKAMRHCAQSARKLVDDLLTYSSTILGEQQLEALDLSQEIEATLHELSDSIAETKAQVNVSIPPARFMADRSQLACLLQNIISNAIKYRKPGQAPRIDVVAAVVSERALSLTITDHGVGFKDEFARTIFEPFKKFDSKIEYAGTGIELAICKSIADRHGWGISVKAQPDEGAAFSFSIPLLVGDIARVRQAALSDGKS
ncbi:MAG TPA: ATP-binding protein [Methylocystis sp.]|nr:ATP-binding protein [Methylocystis sp.]